MSALACSVASHVLHADWDPRLEFFRPSARAGEAAFWRKHEREDSRKSPGSVLGRRGVNDAAGSPFSVRDPVLLGFRRTVGLHVRVRSFDAKIKQAAQSDWNSWLNIKHRAYFDRVLVRLWESDGSALKLGNGARGKVWRLRVDWVHVCRRFSVRGDSGAALQTSGSSAVRSQGVSECIFSSQQQPHISGCSAFTGWVRGSGDS